MTTIGELKMIALDILEQCECFDDEDIVATKGNTYFVYGLPLEVKDGFVDYQHITIRDEEEEE